MVTLTLTDRQYQAVQKAVWARLEAFDKARAHGSAMRASRDLRRAWDVMSAIRAHAPKVQYRAEEGD